MTLACPTCHHADQIQRIEILLDTQTGHSTGEGTASAVGFSTRGGLSVTGSRSSFEFQTASGLVQRFAEPRLTLSGGPGLALLAIVVGAIMLVFMVSAWWALPAVPVVLLCIRAMIDLSRSDGPQRVRHARGYQLLREGYFCHRDGTAFHPSSPTAFTPEGYVSACYSADD